MARPVSSADAKQVINSHSSFAKSLSSAIGMSENIGGDYYG